MKFFFGGGGGRGGRKRPPCRLEEQHPYGGPGGEAPGSFRFLETLMPRNKLFWYFMRWERIRQNHFRFINCLWEKKDIRIWLTLGIVYIFFSFGSDSLNHLLKLKRKFCAFTENVSDNFFQLIRENFHLPIISAKNFSCLDFLQKCSSA